MVGEVNPVRTSIEEGEAKRGPLAIVNLIQKSDEGNASSVLKLEKKYKNVGKFVIIKSKK